MPSSRSKAAVLDALLPDGLDTFIRERRASGDSFEAIARDLHNNHGVPVSGESVRNWHADYESQDAHPAGTALEDGAA